MDAEPPEDAAWQCEWAGEVAQDECCIMAITHASLHPQA